MLLLCSKANWMENNIKTAQHINKTLVLWIANGKWEHFNMENKCNQREVWWKLFETWNYNWGTDTNELNQMENENCIKS